MLLAIFLHPFMLAVVYPALVIAGIVVALLPDQDDITFEINSYKPSVPLDTADVTQVIPAVKRYDYAPNYVKDQGSPIGDELEKQMMARVIAHTFLYEIGQKARQNNLALCA